MSNKTNSNLLIKIRLFTGLLLHWQLIVSLLFPLCFFTKFDIHTGKYFANIDDSAPVSANINTSVYTETSETASISAEQIHLFANLDTRRLYVYRNNKLSEYLFVSGGHANTQTPLGTFSLNINEHNLSFTAPDREYYIRCTNNSNFHGTPTGLTNFSDGDLYLSQHDFTILTEILNKCLQPPTISIHCTTYPWHTLQIGMSNQDVLNVQKMLYTKKYYAGPLNGYYCEFTKQAVIDFQQSHGLFTTGAVNSATYLVLTNQYDNSYANFAKHKLLPYTS